MTAPACAVEMAACGIPVFPCLENKRPATPNGFKNATSDEAELHTLWRRYRGPLIGIPTGPASGLDLLDIDPRHDGDLWLHEMACCIPDTLTVQTRSGGTHFFFKHRPGMRNSESRIAPGVDVRGEGGYAIAWAGCGGFTVRELEPVEWPEWLAVLAMKPKREQVAQPAPLNPEIPSAAHQRDTDVASDNKGATCADILRGRLPRVEWERQVAWETVDGQFRAVETASSGSLHYALRTASRTIGGFMVRLDILEADATRSLIEAARKAGAKDEDNAAKTIASGLALGMASPLSIGRNS